MKYLLYLITGLSLSCSTYAQVSSQNTKIAQVENNLVQPTQNGVEVPHTIAERMIKYNLHGVSIAVIQNYQIVWAKGYGFADAASTVPVTDKTLFQAASISKSLNGVGLLKLYQDKKIDLYADINQYLNTWKFPYDPKFGDKKISVANLLSHTGGLNVHGFAGYSEGKDIPTVPQILDGLKPANSSPIRSVEAPGLRSEYSGGGITISQLLLMDVTHQSYNAYMDNNVLKPLGMTSSTYAQPPLSIKPGLLSSGFRENGNEIPGKYKTYPEQAAAGLWTNPTDLAKYIIETQLAYEGRSAKVLNQANTKLRLTPYLNDNMALGVEINNFEGTKYFSHNGANEGFRCHYYGSIEGGNGVVVMVNSDNSDILQEIIASVAKVYDMKGLYRSKAKKEIAVSADILETYVGKYQLNPQATISVTKKDNDLFAQLTGQPTIQLFAETENSFFLKAMAAATVEFVKNEKGEIEKLIVHQNGMNMNAPRVK